MRDAERNTSICALVKEYRVGMRVKAVVRLEGRRPSPASSPMFRASIAARPTESFRLPNAVGEGPPAAANSSRFAAECGWSAGIPGAVRAPLAAWCGAGWTRAPSDGTVVLRASCEMAPAAASADGWCGRACARAVAPPQTQVR